jgi:hypothetical protein
VVVVVAVVVAVGAVAAVGPVAAVGGGAVAAAVVVVNYVNFKQDTQILLLKTI